MPPPYGRYKPSPEDLAREIAQRLADSRPEPRRPSWRSSLLVGRIIFSGSLLVTGLVLALAVFAGMLWLADRPNADDDQVLGNFLERSILETKTREETTFALISATFVSTPKAAVPPLGSVEHQNPGVTMPQTSTTTSEVGASPPAQTTPTTSITPPPTTSSPTTTNTIAPTTTVPQTSTIPATTTSTQPATSTTTTETTTTTCGNQGGGKGNC